jgi:hypothetical protein
MRNVLTLLRRPCSRGARLGGSVMGLSVLLMLAGCGAPSLLAPDQPTSLVILDEQAAAAAISRYRAQHGLGPVVIDSSLIRAAS